MFLCYYFYFKWWIISRVFKILFIYRAADSFWYSSFILSSSCWTSFPSEIIFSQPREPHLAFSALLEIDFFNHENACISSSFVKSIFTAYRILVGSFCLLFLAALWRWHYCLLISLLPDEKSTVILNIAVQCGIFLFSQTALKIFFSFVLCF